MQSHRLKPRFHSRVHCRSFNVIFWERITLRVTRLNTFKFSLYKKRSKWCESIIPNVYSSGKLRILSQEKNIYLILKKKNKREEERGKRKNGEREREININSKWPVSRIKACSFFSRPPLLSYIVWCIWTFQSFSLGQVRGVYF